MDALTTVQDVVQRSLSFFAVFSQVLVTSLVASVRAMLPSGVLPRKSVKGQVMLITGTGSGIGRLCAIKFAKLGAQLVLWDVNEAGNKETKAIIEAQGHKCFDYTVDLSKREEIYATAERVKREVGVVDILFNNAGIVSGKKLFECPDEVMERTMAINCNALFYTAKTFLPAMLERNHGHIITMASMAGHFGVNGLVDYCASKHAAVGFNEALRSEIKAQGKKVSVTTVSPFYIDTGMFAGIKSFSLMFPILKADYVAERVVDAVLTDTPFLCMPKSCYLYLFLKGYCSCGAIDILADYFGLNHTMKDYVGRQTAITDSAK